MVPEIVGRNERGECIVPIEEQIRADKASFGYGGAS